MKVGIRRITNGSVESLTSVKEIDMAEGLSNQDGSYLFTFDDGRTIQRKELSQLILDTIGEDKKHTAMIASEIGMSYQSVFAVIRTMVTGDILISEKMHKYTAYKIPKICALDGIFNHKSALDNVKIKSKKKYKAEDFPNVSSGSGGDYTGFSSNMSNPVYEGGSE